MAGEVRRLARPHDPAEALVGARLRAAPQAAGLTLAAVAAQAGLTRGFLSRLEANEVSPSVASLVTVCGVPGIGVEQLFQPPETSLVHAADAPPIHLGRQGLRGVLLTAGTQRELQVIRMPGASPHTWVNPSDTERCQVLWALTPAP
ncbi:helix-turn-helix domain-containing protein [Geodermatophilus sp. SYSU D00758]